MDDASGTLFLAGESRPQHAPQNEERNGRQTYHDADQIDATLEQVIKRREDPGRVSREILNLARRIFQPIGEVRAVQHQLRDQFDCHTYFKKLERQAPNREELAARRWAANPS